MNCSETAGFLFQHDCGRTADANCHLCGKGICAMHTRTTEGQIFCITCLKRYHKDRQLAPEQAAAAAAVPQAQQARYGATPWYTYDDPYWYTDHHYPRYHEHDFTAEDRAAFEATPEPADAGTGAAEEAFETQKEAS